MANTINRTIANAKFAIAGCGLPRGFQAMNTKTAATKRMKPKPPNKCLIVFRTHIDGGGDSVFLPYCFWSFGTFDVESPSFREVFNCSDAFSGDNMCQSRPMIAKASSVNSPQ